MTETQEEISERERILEEWSQPNVQSGDFDSGEWCPEFIDCTFVTRLIAGELWRTWHRSYRNKAQAVRSDTILIEGYTLEQAAVKTLNGSVTEEDVARIGVAMEELSEACLVVQRSPGSWELRFAEPFGDEELKDSQAARTSSTVPRTYRLRAKRS